MEDVLDLYGEPYDPKRPVVCFDETSKQLVAEKRSPIPAKAGRRERFDYEYQRNGTRNLFMLCEPLAGWRHLAVTERRTMKDFAHQMRWLVDTAYPEVEKIRVVLDNLNTHRPASLYQTFEPKEARRVIKRLEFHYTPKHGSWLNMAEIEFSVFSKQCLNRRIGEEGALKREIAALETERNQAAATINWRFTTVDARRKLQHIYPSVSTG
jgi:transposase